ncbi:MAG: Chaperone protein DnaJ [Verrucomicrobia subdivision 3 bacterium]|nr:Chaperone protein DnaJ [Limisphaerales bacterium]MCS1413071.1 Chaperone protein DnaJ [Limisphaerales bacterium]
MTDEIRRAYQTLELEPGATLPQVQKAWRQLVQVWHPDRFAANPDLQRKAQERMQATNQAHDILQRYLKHGETPRSRPRQGQSESTKSEPSPKPDVPDIVSFLERFTHILVCGITIINSGALFAFISVFAFSWIFIGILGIIYHPVEPPAFFGIIVICCGIPGAIFGGTIGWIIGRKIDRKICAWLRKELMGLK